MDAIVLGIDGGTGAGIYSEVATIYWQHVMLVPARTQLDLFRYVPLSTFWSLRAGSLVGFGGFHGRRQRFSHWFVTGAEMLFTEGGGIRSGTTTLVGLILTAGYDFRQHFGKDLQWVWGLRAYAGWMPVYWAKYSDRDCDPDDWFCSEQAPRVGVPLVGGLCLFIGFR